MTDKEKYEWTIEVCGLIKKSLQSESDRLQELANTYKEKGNVSMSMHLKSKSVDMVEAQINVTAVESKILFELIERMAKQKSD